MYTYKILDIKTYDSLVDNKTFVEVSVKFYKDGNEYDFKKFGYPLNVTKEHIVEMMEKYCATLMSDEKNKEESARLAESMENVDNLKKELTQS